MILGRNPGLWYGLIQAALNVAAAILVVVTNQPVSPAGVALFAALNGFGAAIVGVIANSSDPTTQPTFALTTAPPRTSSGGTASPPGTPTTAPTVAPVAVAPVVTPVVDPVADGARPPADQVPPP